MFLFQSTLLKLLKSSPKDPNLNHYHPHNKLDNSLNNNNHNSNHNNNNLNNYNLDKLCNKWDNSDLNLWLPQDKLFNKFNQWSNNSNLCIKIMATEFKCKIHLSLILKFINNLINNNTLCNLLNSNNNNGKIIYLNSKNSKENLVKKELISKKLNGLDLMNGSKKLKEIKT